MTRNELQTKIQLLYEQKNFLEKELEKLNWELELTESELRIAFRDGKL